MKKSVIFSIVLLLVFPAMLLSQWGPSAICSHGQSKSYNVTMTSYNEDIKDGVFSAWRDFRSSPTVKIYMQKMDENGSMLWTSNGVEVESNLGNVAQGGEYAQLQSDAVGGCYIVYTKNISGADYIYLAHLDSDGDIDYGPAVVSGTYPGNYPRMTDTGSPTGLIISWEYAGNVIAQKFNGSSFSWGNGVVVNSYGSTKVHPNIVEDGSGGAFIIWLDNRNYYNKWDVYGQRVDTYGDIQWDVNGVLLFLNATLDDDDAIPVTYNHNIIRSGDCVIFTAYNNSDNDVYANKVDPDGDLSWGDYLGINISNSSWVAQGGGALIISDGNDGACIIWSDRKTNNSYSDIYAKRINSSGATVWGGTSGIRISEGSANQTYHTLAAAPIQEGINVYSGNLMVPWHTYSSSSVYFQVRQVSDGDEQLYFPNPVLVSSNASLADYSTSHVIGASYSTGVVTYRASGNIYAKGYPMSEAWRKPGQVNNRELNISAFPNPFNPVTTISYSVANDGIVAIELFNMLGQQLKVFVNNEFRHTGTYNVSFNGESYASGMYFVKIKAGNEMKYYKLMLIK